MTSAGIYIRVSTEEQASKGFSVATQVKNARKYCEEKGYSVIGEFLDEGVSGTLPIDQREGLSALLKAQPDVLVTKKANRLARAGMFDLAGDTATQFSKAGVRIELLEEPNPSDMSGRIMFMLNSEFGAGFIEELVRGSRDAKYEAVEQGNVIAGKRTYGYVKTGDKGNRGLAIDDYSAGIVRELFDMYGNQDVSLQDLVNHVNAKGYQTANDYHGVKRFKGRKNITPQWTRTTLRRILTNPTYIGSWEFGNVQSDTYDPREFEKQSVEVPALIDRALFEKVQKRLDRNRDSKRRQAAEAHPLLGHMECKECGGSYRRRIYKERTYYYCTNSRGKGDCKTHSENDGIRAEGQIAMEVLGRVQSPEHVAEVLKEMAREADSVNQPTYVRIESIRRELAKFAENKSRVIDLHIEGVIAKTDLTYKLEALKNNEAKLEDQLSEAQSQIVRIPGINPEAISELWTDDSFQFVRDFIDAEQDRASEIGSGEDEVTDFIALDSSLLIRLYDEVDLKVVVEGATNEKVYHVWTNLDSVVSSSKMKDTLDNVRLYGRLTPHESD